MKIVFILFLILNLLHLISIVLKPTFGLASNLKYMEYALATCVEIILLVIIYRSIKKNRKQ